MVPVLEDAGVTLTIPLLLSIMHMRRYAEAHEEWMRDNQSERVSKQMKDFILDVKARRVKKEREKRERVRRRLGR